MRKHCFRSSNHNPKIMSEEKTDLVKLQEAKAEVDVILADTANLAIHNYATYMGVRGARTKVQRAITDIETRRKDLKAPHLGLIKLIDTTAKELSEPLEARKQELIGKIDEYDTAKEKERLEKERIEKERVSLIQNSITLYRNENLTIIEDAGISIADLQNAIEILQSDDFGEEFAEFIPNIQMERDNLVRQAKSLLLVRKQAEEQKLTDARETFESVFGEKPDEAASVLEIKNSIRIELQRRKNEAVLVQKTIVDELLRKQEEMIKRTPESTLGIMFAPGQNTKFTPISPELKTAQQGYEDRLNAGFATPYPGDSFFHQSEEQARKAFEKGFVNDVIMAGTPTREPFMNEGPIIRNMNANNLRSDKERLEIYLQDISTVVLARPYFNNPVLDDILERMTERISSACGSASTEYSISVKP